MPWKVTERVSERLEFIKLVHLQEVDFTEACRRFSVAPKTGYKWLARYEKSGPDGLIDRRSVPRRHPQQTDDRIVDLLVAARKQHPTWGAKKVLARLRETHRDERWPAASTVGDILKRQGLIRPRRRRQFLSEPHLGGLASSNRPNDVWAIDFKGHFALGDKTRCHPLTVTDNFSRFLLCCEGLTAERDELARPHLERLFIECGLPWVLRSDNGSPFARRTIGGLSRLAIWLVQLGVRPERIVPGHPEQNGRHERMHRTLKADVAPQADAAAQQRAFDSYLNVFNNERPHEALGQKPPSSVYRASARPLPGVLREPEYGSEFAVRKASQTGTIGIHGDYVRVGPLLSRRPIGVRHVVNSWWEVMYGPMTLGFISEQTPGSKLVPVLPDEVPNSWDWSI